MYIFSDFMQSQISHTVYQQFKPFVNNNTKDESDQLVDVILSRITIFALEI